MALKLMTVDDSRTIRRIVSSYAKALGPDVEIMEAANGQECLNTCQADPPDIIVLDVNMPVMTGEECLRQLREHDNTKEIPVIMLTTESEKQLVVRLLQMGVQQFIIKPFEKQEFVDKVGGVIKKLDLGAGRAIATPDTNYTLVLEDKENIVKTIVDAAGEGATVVGVKEIGPAINHFEARPPDMVLANLTMDGADAFEMFVQMRKLPEGENTRYVGMCLKTANEPIVRARGTGYIEVFTKPFTVDDVKGILKSSGKSAVNTETAEDVFIIRGSGKFQTLISLVLKGIDSAAEDGSLKVIIDLTQVAETELSDVVLWGNIAEKVESLGIASAYISPSMAVVDKLKGLLDTQDLQVTTDEDTARQSLAA